MGKAKTGGGGKKSAKATTQPSLLDGFDFSKHPHLKAPLKQVGKTLEVPGKFWDKCPDADKEKIFRCVIREHSIAHKFVAGPMSEAFQLQEMGERGSGSLEQGDSSGEVFWMHYPDPFLTFYYDTFPEEKLQAQPVAGAGGDQDGAQEELERAAQEAKSARSILYDFVVLESDRLVTTGRFQGQHEWVYNCNIDFCGSLCNSKFTLRAPEGKAPNTGNISRHLMQFTERCPNHRAAYEKFLPTSKNTAQDAEGNWVALFTFEEAFPHHVRFMWMHAEGLVSANLPRRESFREYIRGYEPRATFPHHVTIHRLAETIADEQRDERRSRLKKYMESFKGYECIGLQIDMWTDTDTHTAFACVNATTLIEPTDKSSSEPVTSEVKSEKGKEADSVDSPVAHKPLPQRPPQLHLQSEVLDFEIFPFTEHTGLNIAKWFTCLLSNEGISHDAVAGIAPDGAADGQCAMVSIEDLGEKTDTCDLHRLQRSVLAALGLSGVTSKNPDAKAVLRKNGRIVTLSVQSRAVSDGIRDVQVAHDIPPHKILSTVQTATTRWGNQKKQLSRNAMLKPVIDSVVEKYRRENKQNKEAIVESNESEQGSKVGKAVAASEIGLSHDDWEKTMELEAFVDQPFIIKETIEHGSQGGVVSGPVTGAQSLIMMADLMATCDLEEPLMISLCPLTPSFKDRTRAIEERPGSQLSGMIDQGRIVLKDELDTRFFIARPSNTRLVQCYMSKQKPIASYLPPRMCTVAETVYKSWMRRAALIAGVAIRSSPPRPKKAKLGGVFRASSSSSDVASPAVACAPLEFDTVTDEIQRWTDLAQDRIAPFIDEQGLVNEFALMWNLKDSFPLHYVVFTQTAVHIPHEANVEQVFSTSGILSSPHMDPRHLGRLTMIARNKKIYKPLAQKLLSRYYQKFSKAGKLDWEESTLGLEPVEAQECDSV